MSDDVISKKYRILTNESTDAWDRISFWTKASDVHCDDEPTTIQDLTPTNILKRSKAYSVGDVVNEKTAKSYLIFVCSTAGATASTTPSAYSTASAGTEVTDGTARFYAYDIRPYGGVTNNRYKIPSLLDTEGVNSMLNVSVNGTEQHFYFDYKNGLYGFNTSADRGVSTFHPFVNSCLHNTWSSPVSFTLTAGQQRSVEAAYGGSQLRTLFVIYSDSQSVIPAYYSHFSINKSGTTIQGWGSSIASPVKIITSTNLPNSNGEYMLTFKNFDSVSHNIDILEWWYV